MSDKLCPFCGGSECYSVDDYGDVSVACLYKTHGDTWNTRPLEDAANARAEAAEAKVAALQTRVKELLQQANATYDPYRRALNELRNLVSMKNDALDSYDEFYGCAASLCGLPEDALPGSETDAIILQRLAEHDGVAALQAALQEANEDAARLADKLSEVVAYGGYYADIENRMPPDRQTFKVIAVSPSGVDDFTVLRMDGKLYFASDPPREVPNGFEIIRIKPWDVKIFGKTEEEDF